MLGFKMDEAEKTPPENKPIIKEEQEKKPEEQNQQQPASESKIETASAPSTPQEPSQAQQPNLVETKKKEKKPLKLPHKSFFIATLTIGITIVAGIVLALNLGKLMQREAKTKKTTPVVTPEQTLSPAIPTISSPSNKEATPASKFKELLKPQETKEATASETPTATQEATATQ